MPTLPTEVVDDIIDIVAEYSPEWLPTCALVSREWLPRSLHHINHIFRTPTITPFDALHTFVDVIKRYPHLAGLATSIEVAPDPSSKSASVASYVPFHHLSSHLLPNVHRLALGAALRWADYPPLYHKGTIAFFFSKVTALDLSCPFDSVQHLLRVIRWFRNVKDVRLIYPRHTPPGWVFSSQTHISSRPGALLKPTFKLQNLEMPASSHPRFVAGQPLTHGSISSFHSSRC